jgi:uracil-DNA glycosylase family 4
MGLQRKDVYIRNVVKCRPPETASRKKTKSAPARHFFAADRRHRSKVIVRLGAVARNAAANQPRHFTVSWKWLIPQLKITGDLSSRVLLRNPRRKVKSAIFKSDGCPRPRSQKGKSA